MVEFAEVMPWIDTTRLPDLGQRAEPMEIIGQVFGTAGTVPYVHLQLEMSKRLFGKGGIPTLVANDGDDKDAEMLGRLAEEYEAEFVCWPKAGHAYGDLRIFRASMQWARRRSIDIVAKFSRRFVPLVSWRHGLQYLAAFNTDVSCFTRRHLDSMHGLFRTDAIAYRRRLLDTKKVNDILDETLDGDGTRNINVETMFDSFQKVTGGWAMWDLLGPNFYKPWNKAMQWRGLLPYHYGDLARALDLPYQDVDFLSASGIDYRTKLPAALAELPPVEINPEPPLPPQARGVNAVARVVQVEPGPYRPDLLLPLETVTQAAPQPETSPAST